MDASEIKGQIDFGIITIREDEFRAVLKRFPKREVAVGRRRYNLSEIETIQGDAYRAAVIRVIEQGNGEAAEGARDLLEELDPQWILVVGIAGGVPSNEFSLGDVVVSTHIHDFSVEAALTDGSREYALGGGPVHKSAAIVAADLPAMTDELGDWSSPESIGLPRPPISFDEGSFYGDDAWKKRARDSLKRHFEKTPDRPPLVTAGAIASSDRLIKDTDIARVWLRMARQILAVEMESSGVYRAARGRGVPALAIRGISDVIGVARDPDFTPYACHTAAAFARALLYARPIEPRDPHRSAARAAPPRAAAAPRAQAPDIGALTRPNAAPARERPLQPMPARDRASNPIPARDRPSQPMPAPRAATSGASGKRDKVYISFADQDRDTLNALKEALRPIEQQGILTTWDSTQIRPGEVIRDKTEAAMAAAKVAVLLVSSRYLAWQAHEREVSALLSHGVPLLCLYVDYSLVDLASYDYVDPQTGARKRIRLVDLGALNDPERPLRSLSGSDKGAALVGIVRKIIEAAKETR